MVLNCPQPLEVVINSLDVFTSYNLRKHCQTCMRVIIMGHALKKADRLYIPPRDKSTVAKPRAAISEACSHTGQVKNAFEFGFAR